MKSATAVLLLSCLAIGRVAPEKKNLQEKVKNSIIENNLQLPREMCTSNSSVCPPWALCDAATRKCQCGNIPGDPFECDGVQAKTYILNCYCVITIGNKTEIGQCSYNCTGQAKINQVEEIHQLLPSNHSSLNDFMCKEFGKSGTLCGQCEKERNYYPRAYSFALSCIQCDGSMSSNLWKYIALTYLPLTVFYLLMFFLKVDINSQLQGFIILIQFISAPLSARNILLATRKMPDFLEIAEVILA